MNNMSKLKIDTWIKAGYELYGREGIEGVRVERIARDLQLNKSGFYHYFGSMTNFIKSLLHHHAATAKNIALEIGMCESLDPDLLLLMIRQKEFFLMESQLLLRSKPSDHTLKIDEASKVVNKELLPLWRRATRLPDDSVVALSYLNIILHFFYARIDIKNLTYEFLHSLTLETEDVLNKVMNNKHVSP